MKYLLFPAAADMHVNVSKVSYVRIHHNHEKSNHNSPSILSTGFQFRLFCCLLNADLLELWDVTVDNVQANLH